MSALISVATKLLVSALLLVLATVLLWQAWRVWFNRTLVLTPFDYIADGKADPASGEQFARMVRTDLVKLADLYGAGEVTNSAAIPTANQQEGAVRMALPAVIGESLFDTIEIKAYGIEFGSIFKALRSRLESPSEITGHVTKQGEKISAFVELKQTGRLRLAQHWNVHYAADVQEGSHEVACRIFRLLASAQARDNPDAALIGTLRDEEFCVFNRALAAYDEYRLRKAVLSDEKAAELLNEADKALATLLEHDVVVFPYIYKLAALIRYEQKKYPDAESAINQYVRWLTDNQRRDDLAQTLRKQISSRKLQTTPAVSRVRPLQPGTSVGALAEGTAGMICCIVKDADGRQYLLSAVHALGTIAGSKIVQPAVRDGGTEEDWVADVHSATSTIAIALVRPNVAIDPSVLELGDIDDLESAPKEQQVVVTYGFDGKRREGKIISKGFPLDVSIDEDGTKLRVEDAIITSDLASGGEIGAPVMTLDGKLVGMILGAGKDTTVVVPLESALQELEVELVK